MEQELRHRENYAVDYGHTTGHRCLTGEHALIDYAVSSKKHSVHIHDLTSSWDLNDVTRNEFGGNQCNRLPCDRAEEFLRVNV